MSMLVSYVRDGQNARIGAMVAFLNDSGELVVGHSKWNKTKDAYKGYKFGRVVAIERAEKGSTAIPAKKLEGHLKKFSIRAVKYFKKAEISQATKELFKHIGFDPTTVKHIEREEPKLIALEATVN